MIQPVTLCSCYNMNRYNVDLDKHMIKHDHVLALMHQSFVTMTPQPRAGQGIALEMCCVFFFCIVLAEIHVPGICVNTVI